MSLAEFRIEKNGWKFQVKDDRLLALRDNEIQIEFNLAPVIEGRKTSINRWVEESDGRRRGILSEDGSVLLQVREGHLAYWIETDISHFELLTYFPETMFKGEHWQTYVSDSHDRLWEKSLDAEVLISSAYDDIMNVDGADGNGLTDPGDFPPTFIWNTPVRAFSFDTEKGWFGFSIPGPLPVGVTRLKMAHERFSLTFQVLHPGKDKTRMPVVYLVTGLNGPYDVLDADRDISDKLGLTVKKSHEHPTWWVSPGFKPYLEQNRLFKEKEQAGERNIDYLSLMSKETLLKWVHTVKSDLGLNEMFVDLEQGTYKCYGDYRPSESMGGVEGLRQMVDSLRSQNVRSCHYIHPFMVNTKVDFYREHPEAFCKPKERTHQTRYACEHGDKNPEFGLIDWTHPIGREYILNQVELIISDKPGCLNCDWLRSNHWRSPDPRVYDFHDPDWGIGDLMTMKVQKMLYETVKKIKPNACVSKAGLGAPYMQPYADVDLLAEDWNGGTDSWYKRGRIVTRLIKDIIFLTDPYFLTITKSYEYYMGGISTWCIIDDPIVRHAIHPYLYFRELREKDFRRRKAGIWVHMNAPINITDECCVEPEGDGVTIWRKRTHGPLAGWYAAISFGKRCFATYSETEARISASETRTIKLPLPPGAVVKGVEMVPHEGKTVSWDAEPCDTSYGPGLNLRIEDCGFKPMYFRVRYKLLNE